MDVKDTKALEKDDEYTLPEYSGHVRFRYQVRVYNLDAENDADLKVTPVGKDPWTLTIGPDGAGMCEAWLVLSHGDKIECTDGSVHVVAM